ncbi:hypothetical protein IW138_001932 [Coemansia sp. RSA 986]|nr:hypothetical protein IW138_001932 [Coemansia sp. RSA 986]
MTNQLTLFIAIAASVFFISIVLMVISRRFQGLNRNDNQGTANASAVSLRQSSGRRRAVQFRPSTRPTKPYNPFTKGELHLLHQTTLTQADLNNILAKVTQPNSESAKDNSDAKSVESAELGVLRYASQECSICLAPYEADDSVRVLSCEHVFHCECVDVWLTDRSACCPICKTDNRCALGLEFRKAETDNGTHEEEPHAPNRHHRIDITPPPPIALM